MAQGIVNARVDVKKFNRLLSILSGTSSKQYPDFLNDQMIRFAIAAIKETARADANKIAYQMGQTGSVAFSKPTRGKYAGQFRKLKKPRRIWGKDPTALRFAHRLVNARRRKKGKPPLVGAELDTAAENLRKARMKSIGFIASGWIPTIRIIKGRASKSFGAVKMHGKPHGTARKAKHTSGRMGANVYASNQAIIPFGKLSWSRGNPMRFADEGARKALAVRRKDILDQLEKRMGAAFRRALGPI